MAQKLFEEAKLGNLTLQNHAVMAPMTRSRANADHIPTDIMATYYEQRASAGLIITEGTSPSPNGEGYPRIPGIHSAAQVAGWKPVTDAVHEKGGKIFIQFMHTGRVGHPLNLIGNAEIIAPSAVQLSGQMYTDSAGPQDYPTPRAMTTDEVKQAVQEYVKAAQNAIEAGFDGVELHGANGYLIEQFISPGTNQRTDEYGGNLENRSRFLLEIAEATGQAIGFDKVGVRLSPYGVFNDMPGAYDGVDDTYRYIARELNKLGVVYLHVIDRASAEKLTVPIPLLNDIRNVFKGTLILCGDYNAQDGVAALQDGKADLIAFGRPFIANPDLVARLENGAELNGPDYDTFYAPGPNGPQQGYIDYPVLEEVNG